MYRGDGGCTSHSSNYSIIPDSPIPSRARLSIPPQLTLRAISTQTTPNYMGTSELLRNANVYPIPVTQTDRYKNSLVQLGLCNWQYV